MYPIFKDIIVNDYDGVYQYTIRNSNDLLDKSHELINYDYFVTIDNNGKSIHKESILSVLGSENDIYIVDCKDDKVNDIINEAIKNYNTHLFIVYPINQYSIYVKIYLYDLLYDLHEFIDFKIAPMKGIYRTVYFNANSYKSDLDIMIKSGIYHNIELLKITDKISETFHKYLHSGEINSFYGLKSI